MDHAFSARHRGSQEAANSPPESLALFALLNPRTHPGPHEALNELAAGFRAAGGHSVELNIEEDVTVPNLLRLLLSAAASPASIVFIRHIPAAGALIAAVGLTLRLRRRRLILQVPTPVSSAGADANVRNARLRRLVSRLLIDLSHPAVFLLPHLIVQYAAERGRFASIGANKTHLASHPVALVGTRSSMPDSGRVHVVGVAGSGNSHGFDRFLRGLAAHRHGAGVVIEVSLVGDLEVLRNEVELAERLGLQGQVRFTGPLGREALSDLLRSAHLGIGTLGAHRIGLSSASSLKHRTYLGHGLPLVTSVADNGIGADLPFVLSVPADETPIDVHQVTSWLVALSRSGGEKVIKKWSSRHLGASSIAAEMLAALERVTGKRRKSVSGTSSGA